MIKELQSTLSDMQGKLFELSSDYGYDSERFITVFMKSEIAKDLDKEYNHMQWAGKEYIMNRIEEELNEKLLKGGIIYDKEVLYWAGYLYRQWNFYTGEKSSEILKQANAKTIKKTYLNYHTMSVELVIQRFKETYLEKMKK